MDFVQVILALSVLILSILLVVYMIRLAGANERNKLNDVTNSMLDLELKKREIRDEVNKSSISDLVKSRNSTKD